MGATSCKVIDNCSIFTLEVTWPSSAGAPVQSSPPKPAPTDSILDGGNCACCGPFSPRPGIGFRTENCQHWEGCSLTAYHGRADRPDVWAIGWGCININGQKVTAATPAITQTSKIVFQQYRTKQPAVPSKRQSPLRRQDRTPGLETQRSRRARVGSSG